MSLFDTGIRPAIDEYIESEAAKLRDYGDYWSASSAGFCMRLLIMRRLGVAAIPEIADKQAITQRTFSSGHVFHEWVQRITKNAGLSVAQELQLQDEELMVRGHIDDLVLIKETGIVGLGGFKAELRDTQHLILYDYKTVHSDSFKYKRDKIGHYHRYQLATYMYMLREHKGISETADGFKSYDAKLADLSEARRLMISKDDLRMAEVQLMWDDELEAEVKLYWATLNSWWHEKKIPPCTCLEHDGGFMGRRSRKGKIYNDYFLDEIPCNIEWYNQWKLNKKETQDVGQ